MTFLNLNQKTRAAASGLAMAAMLLATTACDSPAGPAGGDATFQVLLTGSSGSSTSASFNLMSGSAMSEEESPAQFSQVESVEVWISNIHLVGGGHGRVDIFVAENEGDRIYLDLMDLSSADAISLTDEVPVPEDRFGQLRLGVDEVRVTLADGMTFSDGLAYKGKVPGDFLRINLNGDLQIEGGDTMVLVAEWDLSTSLAFQGPPGAPMDVIVKPVLFYEVARNNEND